MFTPALRRVERTKGVKLLEYELLKIGHVCVGVRTDPDVFERNDFACEVVDLPLVKAAGLGCIMVVLPGRLRADMTARSMDIEFAHWVQVVPECALDADR
eukprot:6415985-Amphidinium_carterae.1